MKNGKTGFFTDEWCFWHSTGLYANVLPIGGWVQPPTANAHAESAESKRRLKNLLATSGLLEQLEVLKGISLDNHDLCRIHPQTYLDTFKKISDQGGGALNSEAQIGPGSFEIAKISAGLTAAAVEKVYLNQLDNAYSLSRPPGHHCLPEHAMGFCFLANIPLAIERLKAKSALGKVAIIDWDVHHGNGTQHIYYERNDVLTISLHQENCFPPGYSGEADIGADEGIGFNLNIPLMAGCGHASYLYAFEKIVIPALEKFKPEMIIVASGFDANAFDPLARLMLHSETFRNITALVKTAADKLCQGKLVIVHEGGYAESYVPFCGLAVIEELSNIRTKVEDPCLTLLALQQPSAYVNQFQNQIIDQLFNQFKQHQML